MGVAVIAMFSGTFWRKNHLLIPLCCWDMAWKLGWKFLKVVPLFLPRFLLQKLGRIFCLKVKGPCTGHLRFDWLYTPQFSTNLNRTWDPQSRDIWQCTTQFLTWMDHLLDNDTYICTASFCSSYRTSGPIVEHRKKTRDYDSKHNSYRIEIIRSYQEILIYGYQLHTINLNFDNESRIVVHTNRM